MVCQGAGLVHGPCPVLLVGGLLDPCLSRQAGHLRSLLRVFTVPGCSWGQPGPWKACLIRHFAIWHKRLLHGEDDFPSVLIQTGQYCSVLPGQQSLPLHSLGKKV